MAQDAHEFVKNIESLCDCEFSNDIRDAALSDLQATFGKSARSKSFGYRQLNEALLLLHERIVTERFFDLLANVGLSLTKRKSEIGFADFGQRITEFRKLAMLEYGSFRFAYNFLSGEDDPKSYLKRWLSNSKELEKEFKARPHPLCNIRSIPVSKLVLLGYISGEGIDEKERPRYRRVGRQNFDTYLTWDFLDVYVATSMRKPWDFCEVSKLCSDVFGNSKLKAMRVRHFDPTLSFDDDSVSKGLIEGLMLKRAKCTLYLMQEFDTMGKDSELAATLAQGKPVIAFVPTIDIVRRKKELKLVTLGELLHRAVVIEDVANDKGGDTVRKELERIHAVIRDIEKIPNERRRNAKLSENDQSLKKLIDLVATYEKHFYDKRAKLMQSDHPLRFQMDLSSGVANGVLVARTPEQCAELISRILTNRLDFSIVGPGQKVPGSKESNGKNFLLIEKITHSAFRVVTTNSKLTNSFWNLYKRKEV